MTTEVPLRLRGQLGWAGHALRVEMVCYERVVLMWQTSLGMVEGYETWKSV
jgi:hypothetical protein